MRIKTPDAKPEIFHGLLGELVDLYKPYTEASAVSIAAQNLVAFGNAVGRQLVFYVGETPHHLNENLLLVGTTSRSRKGDSVNIALRPFSDADEDWSKNIASGLSSGEGLIYAVRDATWKKSSDGQDVLADEGVADKRLLIVETEFSTALKQFERQGNTLSNVIRDAWDGKRVLRTLTRNSPIRATDAHISIIAHTTPEDLHAHLTDVDVANGLGNRFLMILTHRGHKLPNPGKAPEVGVQALIQEVQKALTFASDVRVLRRSPAAEKVWEEIYGQLTEDQPGLVGKLLARSEAHVLRLSALYALYARAHAIEIEHQEAALALWDYADASVRTIFGRRTGRSGTDRIAAEMMVGQTLTLTEIRSLIYSNHVTAAKIGDDLALGEDLGLLKVEQKATGGRPQVLVTRLEGPKTMGCAGAKSAKSAKSPPEPMAGESV